MKIRFSLPTVVALVLFSSSVALSQEGVDSENAEPAKGAPKTTPAEADGGNASSVVSGGEPVAIPPLSESLTGAAKAEYAGARILYDDGDYSGALNKLQVAYRLSGDPRLLWNMAAAEKNLRHYSRVIVLIERYLAADSPLVTESDRDQANALVGTIKGFISPVTFDVQPTGATISVDGVDLGSAPLSEPVRLDFGRRKLHVEKQGYVSHDEVLNLEGGIPTTRVVRLSKEALTGTLRIVTDPHTTIRVDGRVVGTGLWEGQLPAGTHAVHLEASEKVPHTTEVVVEKSASRTVNIHLRDEVAAVADNDSLPAWVWVTGGVAAAAALGTGAYFVFREDPSSSNPEMGSWGGIEL